MPGAAAYRSALVPFGRTTLVPAAGHALVSITHAGCHIRVAAEGKRTKHSLNVMDSYTDLNMLCKE